jgi:hypothetical protein
MLRVEFISTEDEPDLIVSFALAPAAHRSLTLLRSPQYEFILPLEERGISVSTLDAKDQGRDLLRIVKWQAGTVTVKTERHEYRLDISAVAPEDVAEAKAVLRKKVRGGVARVEGA